MRDLHICPRCGERVSAFAAGCALCGAELDPRRSQRPPSATQRLAATWRARPRLLPRIGVPERRRQPRR
jgi:predicted amidophosphoribosyltransferase